jgi:Leucine-rich repeat (LRR) protein
MGYSLAWLKLSPAQYSHLVEWKTSSCWIESLPLELLHKVFSHLTINDLKVALQVCRMWREAGESSKLWESASVHIHLKNVLPVSHLLESGRLSRVRSVRVERVTEGLIGVMLGHPALEVVNFCGSNLSHILPGLLANLVERLERVNLRKTKLTRRQLEVILNRLGENRTKLKGLNLEGNDLSSIQPAQLARAVRGLEEVWMSRTKMTAEQQLILAVHSLGEDTEMSLNMEWGNAEGQAAFLWAFNLVHENPRNLMAISDILSSNSSWKMRRLALNNAPSGTMTKELLHMLIMHADIKFLDLSFSSLIHVNPELLATLVTQTAEVNLRNTDLSKKQLNALLLKISQEETKLKRLDLAENNLSSLEPALLASSLPRLTLAGLCFCQLSTIQVEVVLASISQDSSKLEHLSLADNYLTEVDPVLIGQSLVGLKTFNLCGSKLTPHQISVALALIAHSTTLEQIYIDLYSGLDYQLLDEARCRMNVQQVSEEQREKDFFCNNARLLKLLNDCCL